jgi:hypothetical protein
MGQVGKTCRKEYKIAGGEVEEMRPLESLECKAMGSLIQ